MVEFIVSKRHLRVHGKTYSQGEKVELDDTLALLLLEEQAVIPSVDVILPKESDGLFAELQQKVKDLEKTIEQQKGMIANFAAELELKNQKIAEYDATQGKRRK